MPKSKPARMTPDEKRLAREMHFERGVAPSKVAATLGSSVSAGVRLFARKRQRMDSGPVQDEAFFFLADWRIGEGA